MRPLKIGFLLMVLLVVSLILVNVSVAQLTTADRLEQLGGYPCPDSEFTCVKLTVPLDHFGDSDVTIDVVFGVLPASGERKGMFVVATGGPGTSGLAAADVYLPYYDPSIPEHFDMVFFDQRGSVQSGHLQCQEAAATYFQTDQRSGTPEEEAALIETVRTFAEECVQETGIAPELLAYYGTRQAVEDLEAFRAAMGDEQLWLYGESYGTQYAQTYAAAHPDRLAGLILDGSVDLTLPIDEYYAEQAQAFDRVFRDLAEACRLDETCATDVADGDMLAFYDDLTAELAASPIPFEFPLSTGKTVERALTVPEIQYAVTNYMYTEADRHILQRALAAASQGNFVPLARVVYSAFALDPDTLEAAPDPTYSDALFFAVECNDYDYFSGTPDERAEAFLRAGDAVEAANPRFGFIFYGDLPCVFWPGKPTVERPALLSATGVPTIVLGATADAYTPVANGERVYSHLDNGYLITTEGGAHITFAWGNECPDAIITAFLVEDKLPDEREIRCDGVIADPYVPNAPAEAAAYADPLEALNAAYNEMYYLPEYYFWDQLEPLAVGCTYGGTLEIAATDEGQEFSLDSCAFSRGFALTGSGFSSDGVSDFSLDVGVTGDAEGNLIYTYDSEGSISVTGNYDGEAVELTG